ncbi:hypothetical protein RND81_05G094500 [Saponaria officinalis]|uniref:Uncharacterized protein n=1 Tax=Saponaria officinalis TaxID=3572 RepID=A0AAW1KVA7_SAPOF
MLKKNQVLCHTILLQSYNVCNDITSLFSFKGITNKKPIIFLNRFLNLRNRYFYKTDFSKLLKKMGSVFQPVLHFRTQPMSTSFIPNASFSPYNYRCTTASNKHQISPFHRSTCSARRRLLSLGYTI